MADPNNDPLDPGALRGDNHGAPAPPDAYGGRIDLLNQPRIQVEYDEHGVLRSVDIQNVGLLGNAGAQPGGADDDAGADDAAAAAADAAADDVPPPGNPADADPAAADENENEDLTGDDGNGAAPAGGGDVVNDDPQPDVVRLMMTMPLR